MPRSLSSHSHRSISTYYSTNASHAVRISIIQSTRKRSVSHHRRRRRRRPRRASCGTTTPTTGTTTSAEGRRIFSCGGDNDNDYETTTKIPSASVTKCWNLVSTYVQDCWTKHPAPRSAMDSMSRSTVDFLDRLGSFDQPIMVGCRGMEEDDEDDDDDEEDSFYESDDDSFLVGDDSQDDDGEEEAIYPPDADGMEVPMDLGNLFPFSRHSSLESPYPLNRN